ncbi:MAG: thiamine phosphate synthase [Bacteroidetes bacterium CG23_combo_of_CG06-09_8_20_14_all_32_9]|nr:MAG: thiamine phosphate synthase [Bacteroidetes bacterium CG23_combo_of_CG06-09_8_20_14_all_32_9]
MKIIVISSNKDLPYELKQVKMLFNEGLMFFHLRKKNYSENEMRKFIEKIPEKYFNRIVLHSHYHLAKGYNLKGIHLPVIAREQSDQSNLKKKIDYFTVFAMMGKTISTSLHSLEEIQKVDKKFDYAFLSPVFDSISKQDYKSKFDLQNLQKFSKFLKIKNIIALGGIDEDKIDTVKDMGFSGIALLGAIWQNANPVEKFKRIKEKWLKKEFVY